MDDSDEEDDDEDDGFDDDDDDDDDDDFEAQKDVDVEGMIASTINVFVSSSRRRRICTGATVLHSSLLDCFCLIWSLRRKGNDK